MYKKLTRFIGISIGKKWRPVTVVALIVITLTGFYFFERPAILRQQAIASLPTVVMPTAGQKILIYSPHPDDETIALAGYIAMAIQSGADVWIVLVTDGNMHHNEAIRYTEFIKATEILGVNRNNLTFLGLPDGNLHEMDPITLQNQLKKQLDFFNPDIVIYPHPKDMHPDHSTIGKAMYEILKNESVKRTTYQYLVHYKLFYPQPRELAPSLFLLPPESLVKYNEEWQKVMLPQNIEDLKQKAVYIYVSQIKNIELRGLMLASIRQNELLAVPK